MECYRWSLVDPAVIRTREEMEMDQNKKVENIEAEICEIL